MFTPAPFIGPNLSKSERFFTHMDSSHCFHSYACPCLRGCRPIHQAPFALGSQPVSPKTHYKVVGFIVVMAVFFLVSGSDLNSPLVWRLMLVYGTGAAIAFWAGRAPVGTFRPITMAPICIALGSLMMVWALVMAVFVKPAKHRSGFQPNESVRATAAAPDLSRSP